MRYMFSAAAFVAAAIGLAGCNNTPAPPAEPVTEELPVEEAAPPPADGAVPAADAAPAEAGADTAAVPAGSPDANSANSTAGPVTPPDQD